MYLFITDLKLHLNLIEKIIKGFLKIIQNPHLTLLIDILIANISYIFMDTLMHQTLIDVKNNHTDIKIGEVLFSPAWDLERTTKFMQ